VDAGLIDRVGPEYVAHARVTLTPAVAALVGAGVAGAWSPDRSAAGRRIGLAAVLAVTVGYAASPFGIKVVVIEPGAIRTEWGAISADNLEASSAGTVYRDQAKIVSGTLRAADKSRVTSGPEVVAEAIGKAVQLRRPRTRYAVGGGARSILLAQRLLTDRGFDRFIRLMYRVIS
jgi:NAD(P)-dependent dehydrogenase (short-subunit alcohol dehydrogenase family)